ncbi:hypothetical protein PpBr36_03568, partial [Pyricularia pennisetigena]|uniref:hypothetical protein n=1 Tax=Pyricularia pennisetigena TaxID=1578925 RepID=UPI001154E346
SKSSGSSLPGTEWRQSRASAKRGRDLLVCWCGVGGGGATTRVLLGGVLCRVSMRRNLLPNRVLQDQRGPGKVVQQRTPGKAPEKRQLMLTGKPGWRGGAAKTRSAARSRRAQKTKDLTVGKPNRVRKQVIDLTGATQASTEYGP